MLRRVVHPGVVLGDELAALGILAADFARRIDVPANRVSQIIGGQRAITGDTALRLGHWFGTDPQFWLNLQTEFDLALAEQKAGDAIRHLPTKDAPRLALAKTCGAGLCGRGSLCSSICSALQDMQSERSEDLVPAEPFFVFPSSLGT